ncbi:MAG: Trk system potassium transporter TrkA [bacterium]|jgi:trk system potassium uptake protein TrkA|nr:Trk system potassium transporter TrkA [Planctomycetota bacterium]HIL52579.1 Trk system potassium transporter TrkA [Planctomycetota bacterium]
MDITVVGAGEVGFHLARILSREDHRVSVVDADPVRSRSIMESLDVQVILGDATSADVLTRAGVPKTDLLVVVTDDDKANLLTCVLARALGARRIILRLHDLERLEDYRYFYKQAIGFDVVLSTEEFAAEEVVSTVREHHALEVESFVGGRIQLRRYRVDDDSQLLGGTLAELDLPSGVLIGGVSHKKTFVIPTGEDRIEPGSQIYVIGKSYALDAFERMNGAPTIHRRSVVLLGAGGLSRSIVHRLKNVEGVSLRVIERDHVRAKTFAAEFSSDVMVIDGDVADLEMLTEERVGEAHTFIAASGDDEQNLVACHLLKALGVERTIALVNKSSYRYIFDMLGVDHAISPRITCANRILRFVRADSVYSVAVLGEGRAEVLEIEVKLSGKKTSAKIKSLGLPPGTVIGGHVRDDEVEVPDGETLITSGDHVIVFCLPENVKKVLSIFNAEADS